MHQKKIPDSAWIWHILKPLFFMVFIILPMASGCAVNRQAADKLAKQGLITSQAIGQSYQVTNQQIEQYVEGEYLLSGLKPGYSPPSETMLENIRIVKRELHARQKMMEGLGNVYTAFGALCAHDAKGEVEKAVEETGAAGNELAAALGNQPLANEAGALFAKASGGVTGFYHSQRIKRSSKKIRSLLKGVILLLEKGEEEQAIIAIREEVSRGREKAAKALWQSDIALADSILEQHVKAYGLTLNKVASKKASTNKALNSGICNVLQWRQKQEAEALAKAYNAAIGALKELGTEHSKIEAGEPVSLGAIQGYLATIREYVDLAAKLKNGDK
jgi:hypothetical protein